MSRRGVVLLCKVDGVVLGVAHHTFVQFDFVIYGCGLYRVGFHMCVVKFQDVGFLEGLFGCGCTLLMWIGFVLV